MIERRSVDYNMLILVGHTHKWTSYVYKYKNHHYFDLKKSREHFVCWTYKAPLLFPAGIRRRCIASLFSELGLLLLDRHHLVDKFKITLNIHEHVSGS